MSKDKSLIPYTPIHFSETQKMANHWANDIEAHMDELLDILLTYESYEVAQDEIARTLDLLRNLKENEQYFRLRVGAVTSFLPRNQPLYAFSCFVIVPSFMASEVHFRIPQSMRCFFPELIELFDINKLFPNIFVSSQTRLEFLKFRSANFVDLKNKDYKPITDVVIFTGNPNHAEQLRSVFDKRTLFISNGAGHNPVIVSKSANLIKAAEAVCTLQFYNQGQDCAAPNSILVDKNISHLFLEVLRSNIQNFKVGPYSDRSCRIGPISDPKDLSRIQDFLVDNREWLDPSTPGTIRTKDAVVEPTIICKPLSMGGNFKEIFAPIVFLQEFANDAELKTYFEDPRYSQNAMYITLYGENGYVQNMIDKSVDNKILHPKATFLHNTHLHIPGVERGTKQYGGYGYGASSISIGDKLIAMPTLPQRDIYKFVAKPLIAKRGRKGEQNKFTKIQTKDVEKLLRLNRLNTSQQENVSQANDILFVDLGPNTKNFSRYRYIETENKKIYKLLKERNVDYIASLEPEELQKINSLKSLLKNRRVTPMHEFCSMLYNIPKDIGATESENKIRQLRFFKNIYHMLFGKDSGPQLGPFLWSLKTNYIHKLINTKSSD